jgi:hypothetical protein
MMGEGVVHEDVLLAKLNELAAAPRPSSQEDHYDVDAGGRAEGLEVVADDSGDGTDLKEALLAAHRPFLHESEDRHHPIRREFLGFAAAAAGEAGGEGMGLESDLSGIVREELLMARLSELSAAQRSSLEEDDGDDVDGSGDLKLRMLDGGVQEALDGANGACGGVGSGGEKETETESNLLVHEGNLNSDRRYALSTDVLRTLQNSQKTHWTGEVHLRLRPCAIIAPCTDRCFP